MPLEFLFVNESSQRTKKERNLEFWETSEFLYKLHYQASHKFLSIEMLVYSYDGY